MSRLLAVPVLLLLLTATAQAALPPNFVIESATPGLTFDTPTGLAFLPDGRLLVTEKAGRVWMVQSGIRSPQPLWHREQEVLNLDDKGLLSVAVDPHYFLNHYIYLLYTVDPDSDGVDTNSVAFGRLTRYTVGFTDSSVVDPATRTILMGATWRDAPEIGSPTHSIGALHWGADGSLLVSVGEGAQYTQPDLGGQYPSLFLPGRADPYEDIGSFRSQYVGSLDGKVLRLDPATGHGYPSNPYFDGDDTSKRSRVWVYGLRNPFRFTVKPGTGSTNPALGQPGTLYIGDVGFGTYEEADVARQGGINFGWPCMEGIWPTVVFQGLHPAHSGCDSTGTYGNPAPLTLPTMTESHSDPSWSTPPGVVGNCIVMGVFYQGTRYPAAYQGRLFFGDYGQGTLKILVTDSNDQLVQVNAFGDGLNGPVAIDADPVSGDLYYVSINAGEVRRLRYTSGGTNQPPVAVAAANPSVGPAPLAASFSSAGSNDPDGDTLTYSWIFGDGAGSTLANPSHTYTTSGTFAAILTVDDGHGLIGRDTLAIVVGSVAGFPTTPIVDDFNRANGPIGNGWTGDVGSALILNGALTLPATETTLIAGAVHSSPNQEAYYTFAAISPSAAEQNLMLAMQGPNTTDPHIEITWDAAAGHVNVWTLTPGPGWEQRGEPIPVAYQAGDRFGTRVYSNGGVEVYRNSTLVGTTSVTGWPYAGTGGRIGMSFWGAGQTRVDDFGGGDAVLGMNTPPVAAIVAPVDSTFYDLTQTVMIKGHGTDAQSPPDSLQYRWDVILHHNNHTHPGSTIFADSSSFQPVDHSGDGTPVWYETRFIVTDPGGLSDTTRRYIFPRVDLVPTGLGTNPATVMSTIPAEFHFTLHNAGTMPDPRSHWQLTARGAGAPVTVAQGDTLAGAGGSVTVSVMVPAVLATGQYSLRVTVDTTNVVIETDETNDAMVVPLTVIDTPAGVDPAALHLALSPAYPNPTGGAASVVLELPARARVALDVLDPMGRLVWSQPPRELDPGRWTLAWPGLDRAGRAAGSGLYLARLTVGDRTFVRRVAILR